MSLSLTDIGASWYHRLLSMKWDDNWKKNLFYALKFYHQPFSGNKPFLLGDKSITSELKVSIFYLFIFQIFLVKCPAPVLAPNSCLPHEELFQLSCIIYYLVNCGVSQELTEQEIKTVTPLNILLLVMGTLWCQSIPSKAH